MRSGVANDLIFAPTADPLCQLPCWQELRIGKSKRADVQRVIRNYFGFDPSFDIFTQTLTRRVSDTGIPETYESGGYTWGFGQGASTLGVYVEVARDRNTLEGIKFLYEPFGIYRVHTVQDIIRKLGSPTYILGGAGLEFTTPVAEGDKSYVNLLLIYDQGMVFWLTYSLTAVQKANDGKNMYTFEYCLDQAVDGGDDFIVAPITNLDEKNLDDVQKAWFSSLILSWPNSVQEILGIDNQGFVKLAFSDHSCIELHPR